MSEPALDRRSETRATGSGRAHSFFVVALVVLLVSWATVDWYNEPYPLSDAHWDSSIYLLRARNYATGHTLEAFRDDAIAIHDAVLQGVYPTPYWSFMRLGQTVLLGTVVGVTGSGEASIHVLTWLYRALLAAGLFVGAMLPAAIVRAIGSVRPETSPRTGLYAGVFVSVALYLLSEVAGYMGGNLVSEVPAIALVALSGWALVTAWSSGSIGYAVASGCAGFALYVVRMESVWIYVALLLAMTWLLSTNPQSAGRGWRCLITAALTAGLLFVAYSWVFFPLTDPRLVIGFSAAVAKVAFASHPDLAEGTAIRVAKHLVAANGMLWIGAIVGLPTIRTSRAYQFAVIWLLVALLPVGIAFTQVTTIQTRMFTTLTPLLLVLSSIGWARLFSVPGGLNGRILALALVTTCAVMISQSVTYARLRALPGMWRLQFVRAFLAPMPFERIDYRLPELVIMERSIATLTDPNVLIASKGMQIADHIMVVQYLAGASAGPLMADGADAQSRVRRPLPRILLSKTPEEDIRFVRSLPARESVLLLGTAKEREWIQSFDCCAHIREVVSTPNFTLVELTRACEERCDGQ